ncbi:MAG: UDP-N-acetylmuramate--L-alanine ligase [Ruminococcaceae bacterium]|nr:UDP-N-acetylmuramate--L-alanine ligase [Oscillospiraceae bacterium]
MEQQLQLDKLNRNEPIYMIGIGGISMSALAVILKKAGYAVCGSDCKTSDMTASLQAQGIPVHIGHCADNMGKVSAVVYTAAVQKDNPELVHARTLSVPVVERAVLLGEIMKHFKTPIAVSGTHGKTTTTSMLSQVLLEADFDPTILVGGILSSIGSNMRIGSHEYLVTEACEYCGSFLKFFPKISLILNVEEDHLDYFKDIHDIIDCFHAFAEKTPEDGVLIVNRDDKNAMAAVRNVNRPILTFSTEKREADFVATDITYGTDGCATFTILRRGVFFMEATLSVPGLHNVKNALAVAAAADFMGIVPASIQQGFSSFSGSHRRFEERGMYHGARIIDDYAHHPTEIKTTLSTARKAAGEGKIWCVFQPHTYTRAYKLREEFAKSFFDCDGVIVVDIYAAREQDTGLIHARDIAKDIENISHNACYGESFAYAENWLKERVCEGDYIITLGAGDVNTIGAHLADCP